MGIDIFMRWDGMTLEERRYDADARDDCKGHTGYLRESYHGGRSYRGPFATMVLLREAFNGQGRVVRIRPDKLIGRLERTCGIVIRRYRRVYGKRLTPESPEVRAYVDFVALYVRLEREGRRPRIFASY